MSKKITMQSIADAVGVSRVTIWKVFNNQPGVSEDLQKTILEKAQELGYRRKAPIPISPAAAPKVLPTVDGITVGVIVSRPDSSLFWTNMIHRIAKELSKQRINLMYTYVPSWNTAHYQLPTVLKDGTVQGVIVLNVYDTHILGLINRLSIPKVFYDTVTALSPSSLNGDVVLLEGREKIRELTTHIIEKGRRKIGFIGDIAYARTNADRYEGFLDALAAMRVPCEPEWTMTGPIDIGDYYGQIKAYLEGLVKWPEAFVCVSDYVAHFLCRVLAEKGLKVPEDIAVSGYDGSSEYSNVEGMLTTVVVQTSALGKRLALQLLLRIENPDFPQEVVYVNPRVAYGASTDF